jgi:hypothetical protein
MKYNLKELFLRFLPLFLLVFTIVLFFFIIPTHIAERIDVLLAIVGGVLTLVFTIWVVSDLIPVLFDKIPIITGLLCISSLFIFGVFFLKKTTHYASDQINQNGILTEAIILNKTRMYTLKGNSTQSMKVRYTTNDRKVKQTKILLSEREFKVFEKGMTIWIYYSSKNPSIATIAHKETNKELEKKAY